MAAAGKAVSDRWVVGTGYSGRLYFGPTAHPVERSNKVSNDQYAFNLIRTFLRQKLPDPPPGGFIFDRAEGIICQLCI